MSESDFSLSRRKFVAVSSAAVAAPILKRAAGAVPNAGAAQKTYNLTKQKDCDLVVLGGGASGIVAAVRAAQLSGKKVVVLEKDSVTGGGGRYAAGIRTFGSKWQAKRNLENPAIEYARQMMDSVYWRLDEKLVLNILMGTGQFFDWLCEQGGDIDNLFDVLKIDEGPPGPDINFQRSGKTMGLFITDMMKEKCEKYGVEVLTKHPVVDVVVKSGKIVAAIAKSSAGYIRVVCKACIMSIGSWINNEEIVKKYVPKFAGMTKYMDPSPHFSSNYTGDGIALAMKVGAFLDYDSFCLRLSGPVHGGATSRTYRAMGTSPYIITVNLNGKRYCSEPISHMGEFSGGPVQMDQPHGQSFSIFDENAIAATLNRQKSTKASNGASGGTAPEGPLNGAPQGRPMGPGRGSRLPDTMEEIQRDLRENLAKSSKYMFRAYNLEELADKIGVNKRNFLETVRAYNDCCARGEDSEFFKSKDNLLRIDKAPYYALLGMLGTDGAFGGVRVNPDIRAYKSGGGLVEGLWVTGDFASGRHVNLGGIKRQVITDLSWAFTSGFLAGTNASKYLDGVS
jgi:fumarate reductase flavoprotein subunit